MLNLYDDIPDQYTMQKMIYDDNTTLQDLINQINKTDNQKIDAKPYDYNYKTLAALVNDDQIGGNQTSGVAPEPSETKQGGSMGLKIENKKSLKKSGKYTSHPSA